MKWHKLPQFAMESKAPIQLIKLAGHRFCLIYEQGCWHATSAKCPHSGANLAEGWCENGQLICPYHRHRFDLHNGKGAIGQNNFIHIYRIEEHEDGLYIELPESIFSRIFKF